MATGTSTQTCYRHPNRETGVSCSNCGRPICPDCMTPTPVGMRCPECARERTPVRTMRNIRAEPVVTYALIAINVVAWIAEVAAAAGHPGGGWIYEHGALFGPLIDTQGEYWRIVTGAFLHDYHLPFGILHVGFNMYALKQVMPFLERFVGVGRTATLYLASGVVGSMVSALWGWTHESKVSAGASGADEQKPVSLWWYVMLAVLALAVAESWLGNQHLSVDKEAA